MTVSQFVLEILKVSGPWPPVVLVLMIVFMTSQRKSISDLIGRIIQIKFPGGGLELPKPEYQPNKVMQKSVPVGQYELHTKSPDFEDQINSLAVDFRKYMLLNLQSNKQVISNLLDVIWRNSGHGFFGNNQPPEDFMEKTRLLSNDIDQKAIKDLINLETILLKDQPTREELVQTSLTSNLLVEYFRGMATIGWRSVLQGYSVSYPSTQKK